MPSCKSAHLGNCGHIKQYLSSYYKHIQLCLINPTEKKKCFSELSRTMFNPGCPKIYEDILKLQYVDSYINSNLLLPAENLLRTMFVSGSISLWNCIKARPFNRSSKILLLL